MINIVSQVNFFDIYKHFRLIGNQNFRFRGRANPFVAVPLHPACVMYVLQSPVDLSVCRRLCTATRNVHDVVGKLCKRQTSNQTTNLRFVGKQTCTLKSLPWSAKWNRGVLLCQNFSEMLSK